MGKPKAQPADEPPRTFEVPALAPRRSTIDPEPIVRFEAILGSGFITADKAGHPVLKMTLVDPGAEWFLYALRERAAERLTIEVYGHNESATTFEAVLAELMGGDDAQLEQ